MPQNTKKIVFWSVLGVAAVITALALVSPAPAPQTAADQNQPAVQSSNSPAQTAGAPGANEPPPDPVFQTSERRLEILVVRQDGTFRARDVDSNEETDMFIPSDANITAGSRQNIKEGTQLTVQKYMVVANGLVAVQLSVPTVQ